MSERIPHRHNDDIPILLLDETNIDLELNRPSDDFTFIEVSYGEGEEIFA